MSMRPAALPQVSFPNYWTEFDGIWYSASTVERTELIQFRLISEQYKLWFAQRSDMIQDVCIIDFTKF